MRELVSKAEGGATESTFPENLPGLGGILPVSVGPVLRGVASVRDEGACGPASSGAGLVRVLEDPEEVRRG